MAEPQDRHREAAQELAQRCPKCGGKPFASAPDIGRLMCMCGPFSPLGPELQKAIALALAEAEEDGSRPPTIYCQGMEDGEDHCTVCSGVIGLEDAHTHQHCFEEGKNLGALDENIDCAQKLAERIGCEVSYFHEVIERVPPAQRLPGTLRQATLLSCDLVHVPARSRDIDNIRGLEARVFIPMPIDPARFTHEHIGRIKKQYVTVQVSIDDSGHTCWSPDGVTCGLCQRDMTPGSAYAEEQAAQEVARG